MNETLVTLQGYIGGQIRQRETAGGPLASFRVACTPSWFDQRQQQWVDGETQWYTVTAWRTLAQHCAQSLSPGDPVVVHGQLTTHAYEHEGVPRLDLEIKAKAVGHNLARGTTTFTKMAPPQPALPAVPEEVAA